MELIREIVEIYDNYEFTTEVLVASCRNPMHIVEAARMGADICTCPPAVIDQLFNHPLTDIGLEKFLKDWEKAHGRRARRLNAMDRHQASRGPRAPRRARRRRGAPRAPARGRQADRARAHRAAVRSRHVRGARQARHAPLPRLRHGASRSSRATASSPGHGLIDGRPGVRLRAGLHRVRRLAVGDQRREDREDHGPRR